MCAHKEVDIGTVTGVALSKDLQRVIVTVEMKANAEPLLTTNAKFWVVKPRLFAGSISGLDTLFSGAYIEPWPNRRPAAMPQRDFVGLEDPPVLQSNTPGTNFLLHAPRIGSIQLGSPLFYRDLAVGEVLGWDIGDMAESVNIHVFVRQPFDRYVHDNSRFWNASGLSIKLGGTGVQVQLESLKALILGGIAFDTPAVPGQQRNDPKLRTAEGHEFPLYASKEAADSAAFGRKVPLVSYFDGSVAGLEAGADVTLHGLKIGTITSVGLQYDKARDMVIVPVHYTVEPERIADAPIGSLQDMAADGQRAGAARPACQARIRQPDHRPAAGGAGFRAQRIARRVGRSRQFVHRARVVAGDGRHHGERQRHHGQAAGRSVRRRSARTWIRR